jgi:hypothetical protein
MQEIIDLQNKISELSILHNIQEAALSEVCDSSVKNIAACFEKEYANFLNGKSFHIALSGSTITIYLENQHLRTLMSTIRLTDSSCQLTHNIRYETNNTESINITKMVLNLITSIDTKDVLYETIVKNYREFEAKQDAYYKVSSELRALRPALKHKLYHELRRQLVDGFKPGDKYRINKGLAQILEISDKWLKFKIVGDSTERIFDDPKNNFAHQILEKAPERSKKIAEMLINSSGFKK